MTFNTLATRIPLYNNFSGVGEKGTPSGTQDASSIKQHQITLWENHPPPLSTFMITKESHNLVVCL